MREVSEKLFKTSGSDIISDVEIYQVRLFRDYIISLSTLSIEVVIELLIGLLK